MPEPADDFDALVAEERQKLALYEERTRIEEDRAAAHHAAQAAETDRVIASAHDLKALAQHVAQQLSTRLDKNGTIFYFRISSPHEGQGGTAGLIPRTRGWNGAVYSKNYDYNYLALSTNGRLLWARGFGTKSGFVAWADLSKLRLDEHDEIRRGLARLMATHGAS